MAARYNARMLAYRIRRPEYEARLELTPLLDVIFLLLTFFIYSVVLIWRDQQDSNDSDVEGFEQWLDLTWDYRQTTVYASIRNSMLDSDDSDSLFQTFLLGIRREF